MIKQKQYDLSTTVDLMLSDDYKERFKAEYLQLKIRHRKLCKILDDYVQAKLKFELTTDWGLLRKQEQLMDELLMVLRVRAKLEGIDLDEYFN